MGGCCALIWTPAGIFRRSAVWAKEAPLTLPGREPAESEKFPVRSTFQQNQYGGTFGGPIKKSRIFFFGDYQGQRTVEGIETGLVSVPSLLNRELSAFFNAVTQLFGSERAKVLEQKTGCRS